jgi:hypothetical protein
MTQRPIRGIATFRIQRAIRRCRNGLQNSFEIDRELQISMNGVLVRRERQVSCITQAFRNG